MPIQVIQENVELEQLQVEDWEDEASEDKAIEEIELARVQQEIVRLCQEQEGRQQLSMPKPKGSTSIEKEKDF
jgi:hypothetical protein